MALIKLYSAPALLLLLHALTCSLGHALPVTSTAPITDSCVSHARALLQNITAALAQHDLFRSFNCSKQNVKLNTETSTASACAPEGSTCFGSEKSKFDQESCLEEIKKDLNHYNQVLAAQFGLNNVLSVQSSLREFMKNCWSLPTDSASREAAAAQRVLTYDQRQDLCKVLKGFQVRMVTINRAIGHMKSAEHME